MSPKSRKMKVMAVLKSEADAGNVRAAFEQIRPEELDVRIDDFRHIAPTIVNGHAPDILLVDLGLLDPEDVTCLSNVARETARRTAIVATAERASVQDIRQLMRFGVADFVPQPFAADDLLSAIDIATERLTPGEGNRQGGTPGKVVTFLHAGGGVGATTVLIQTAAEFLSRDGAGKPEICILDFDLQSGNAALSLDLANDAGVIKILESPARLDIAFLRGATVKHASGLSVLAAPPSIVPLDAMSPEVATTILDLARQEYELAIVDMPPVWASWSADVIGTSDLVVLVGEMTVPALDRCKRHIDLLRQLGEVPLLIAVNRFEQRWGWRHRKKQAEKILGRKIDILIRSDAKTSSAARDQGVLLREIKRRSRIEKDVRRLVTVAQSLLKIEAEPNQTNV